MKNIDNQIEFYKEVSHVISHPIVQQMKGQRQHNDGMDRYSHSLCVAYISYKISKKIGLNANSCAIAGLLHDTGIENCDKNFKERLISFFSHAKKSEEVASDYFDLSELEKNIIKSHMWPTNIINPPLFSEAVVVNLVDKYCAVVEFLGLYSKYATVTNTVAQL